MRGLFNILQMFEIDTEMEYCEEFHQIKAVLVYCNNEIRPFNKLQFRGGHASYVDEIAGHIQKILLERNLVSADTKEPLPEAYPTLRKILMFLLVNTDVTYKYNIADDDSLVHLCDLYPPMKPFLLVAVVWELKLDRFLYEALKYTPCWFAFQHFDAATDSLWDIADPFKVLEKVEQLVRCIFTNLSRSKYRQMDKVDKKIIFGYLHDYTMNLLRVFYTPDAEKFKNFTKNDHMRYFGFALLHVLQMVEFSFDMFEASDLKPEIDIKIYQICPHLNKPIEPDINAKPPNLLEEHALKIITALLNTLQHLVMLVQIHMFLYWVEVDLTPKRTLQLAIGELAYKVLQRILANPSFDHDIQHQLKEISIRPKTLEEITQKATLGDILRALDEPLEPLEKNAWYKELLKRPMALNSDECLQSISEHRKLMTVENVKDILDFLMSEVDQIDSASKEDKEIEPTSTNIKRSKYAMDIVMKDYQKLLSVLLIAMEQQFDDKAIVELVEYQIKLFGTTTTICCMYSDFEKRSTLFFNKLTSDIDKTAFLILCFENPTRTWEKFFDCVLEKEEVILFLCSIATEYRTFSDHYLPALLQTTFATSAKMQAKCFPEMLCIIYHKLYYPDRKLEFLKGFVNKTIIRLVDAQQLDDLVPVVTMMSMIDWYLDTNHQKFLNFGEFTAPILYTSALVLDRTRWDLNNYTSVRDSLVCNIIRFIQAVSKKFLPVASEQDRKWIALQVQPLRPMTQFYFQKYSLTSDQPQDHFDMFLMRCNGENYNDEEFVLNTFHRCTKKESEWLGRSSRLLPYIPRTVMALGIRASHHGTSSINVISNYRHVLASFANIVKTSMLPAAQNDLAQLVNLIKIVLEVIESTPQELYADTFLDFVRLLEEIIQANHCGLTTDSITEIVDAVQKTEPCLAKEVFLDKLQIIKMQLE